MHPSDESSPRIRRSRFLRCQDHEGREVTVGVGVTGDRRVVLIGPPDGVAVLTPAQRDEYQAMLVEAVMDASS